MHSTPYTNRALQIEIARSGRSHRSLAKQAKIIEQKFSAILHGWIRPREDEQQRIADGLGVNVGEIFLEDREATTPK